MFCRKVVHLEQGRASAIPEKPRASEELENGTGQLISHSSKKGPRGLVLGRQVYEVGRFLVGLLQGLPAAGRALG